MTDHLLILRISCSQKIKKKQHQQAFSNFIFFNYLKKRISENKLQLKRQEIIIVDAFCIQLYNIFVKIAQHWVIRREIRKLLNFSNKIIINALRYEKLSSEVKSYSEIRKLLNCSNKMTINALRYEPKVESRGRKRIFSLLILKCLIRTTKNKPFMPAKELRKELNAPASVETIPHRQ